MFKKIYVDLDGVLADFDGKYIQVFGEKNPVDSEMWKHINAYDKWFRNLPLMKDGLVLWNYVNSLDAEVKILTATGWDYHNVSNQKIEWCKEHLGIDSDRVITVRRGLDKSKYAENYSCLLIDDMHKNIDEFAYHGGSVIWHTSVDYTIKDLAAMLVG